MSTTIPLAPFEPSAFVEIKEMNAAAIHPAQSTCAVHQPIRLLQGVAILMIVVIHSVIPGHHYSGVAEVLDRFIRSCAVPLFMTISGFLYRRSTQSCRPYGRIMKEKAVRLLLPYVAVSSVAFLIKALLGRLAVRPVSLSRQSFAHHLLYPWDNAIVYYWFLPTLFLIFAVSIALDKWVIKRQTGRLVALIVILAALAVFVGVKQAEYPIRFLNLCGVCYYLFYFWLGFAFCQYEPTILQKLGRSWRAYPLMGLALLMTIALPDPDHALAVLEAVLGFTAMFATVTLLSRRKQWTRLAMIGDRSYQIYLLSWFFQTLPIVAVGRFISNQQYVCAAASFLLGTTGPLCATYLLRKMPPRFGVVFGLRQQAA
jgi:fucose 4-O-acetylase-like acetyltransferase